MPIWTFRNTKIRSQMSYMWSGIGDEPLPETWTDIHAFIQKTNPKLFFTDGTGNTGNRLAISILSALGRGSIGTVNSIPLYFRTGDIERMYIDTEGNLNMGEYRILNVPRIERTATDDALYLFGGMPGKGSFVELFGENHATRPGEANIVYTWKKSDGTLTNKFLRVMARDNQAGVAYELFRYTKDSNKSLVRLDMNLQKITNLASPTVSSDAATKGYVDGIAPVAGMIMPFTAGTDIAYGSTEYLGVGYCGVIEDRFVFRACRSGTAKNLAVNVKYNTMNATTYVRFRKNKVNTVLVVSIGAGVTGNITIDTDSVSFTSADVLSLQVDTTASTSGYIRVNASVEIV